MGTGSTGLKSFGSFGGFSEAIDKDPFRLRPITTEFSKGSIPNSISAANRESAWTRWRKGAELAASAGIDNNYNYKFKYTVPFPPGVLPAGTNYPDINGIFIGFPTKNKELGIHWAGEKSPGSVRFDQLVGYNILLTKYWLDAQFTDSENIGQWLDEEAKQEKVLLYIQSITEDANYWYVKLNGDWSPSNKLPPPLYIDIAQSIEGLKALNGEVLEDRIIEKDGPIIDRNTINPLEFKRYGYVQAVLVDTDEETGILKLKKAGSVEATPDGTLVTPATRPPNIGRYFITGPRYCCTCQDFTHRDYSYLISLGATNKKAFPRTTISNVKPGRYDVLTKLGVLDSAAMTPADVNRVLEIITPNQNLELPTTVTPDSQINRKAARDNPGVYREFGSIFLRSTNSPGLSGSTAEGLTKYEDYAASNNQITSLTDIWVPVLDELRYCKHIYAMRFQDHIFPPEPSDFPVEIEEMSKWEQKLVIENENDQKDIAKQQAIYALSYMDVPPYNCQSQHMQPMLQRLFNIPLNYINISGFTMYDKNDQPYVPALGERPGM